MHPDIRRMIAVDAHRRRTGFCPTMIHSLGTGESFEIKLVQGGFIDLETGLSVRFEDRGIVLPEWGARVDVASTSDVAFAGFDHLSNEPFSGRSGGGASVTIYDAKDIDYFQYAIGPVAPSL